jgi:hypothetical protein
MATTKKRSSPRKETSRDPKPGANLFRFAKTNSNVILGSVLIGVLLVGLMMYRSGVEGEARASKDEQAAYDSLSRTLNAIKPELEAVSPVGVKWTLDRECHYTHKAIREGDRFCKAYLTASVPYGDSSGADSIIGKFEDVLADHSEYFHPIETREFSSGSAYGTEKIVAGKYSFDITGLACDNVYEYLKNGLLRFSIGCEGMARKEYYPVNN